MQVAATVPAARSEAQRRETTLFQRLLDRWPGEGGVSTEHAGLINTVLPIQPSLGIYISITIAWTSGILLRGRLEGSKQL
jgi:hypothetical protein